MKKMGDIEIKNDRELFAYVKMMRLEQILREHKQPNIAREFEAAVDKYFNKCSEKLAMLAERTLKARLEAEAEA